MPTRYVDYDHDSGTVLGFYADDVQPLDQIPAGALPVDDAQWRACITTPGAWRIDPATQTWVSAPPPPPEAQAAAARSIVVAQLRDSDESLIRAVEDLITLLLAKHLITASDLPQAVRDKLAARAALRAQLGG